MRKIKVLYLSGTLLAVFLVIFIYSQILDTATSAAPKVEHSSVKTDQRSLISFKIYNEEDQDSNYTYTIFLDDRRLTKENPVLVKAGKEFLYSMEIPSDKGGSKANVLIYRGVGEEKTLIDNKTYYLK